MNLENCFYLVNKAQLQAHIKYPLEQLDKKLD